MKVPLSWLRDYVEITMPVAQLAERLTLAGMEVAGIRPVGLPVPEGVRVKSEDQGPVWDRDKIVVAQILEVQKHPDADKLKLPFVDLGDGKPKQLVTGAPNINVGDRGQKVVVALTGSTLFDGHAKEKKLSTLKPTKIRGIPSDAMVCSQYELGIAEDHEGIILLDDDAPVGVPFADYMGDYVLEIDILPNMARCLSMIGIAREVAAITGQQLRLPPTTCEMLGEPVEGQVAVVIEDPTLSARYSAMLLRGVKVGPSPYWMKRRLTLAGMRPISNLVDVTNYVMLEWGQPLHAFDHDKLVTRAGGKAPTITVRAAKAGEKLTTLDGKERVLTPENLLITDTAGPIALAGVMGGAETEVAEATTSVLLESASFHFVSIRKTARKFDLGSEASARFSRAVHPALVEPAALRASDLMRHYGGAVVCKGMVDAYPAPLAPQVIDLPLAEVRRQLGLDVSRDDAARVLQTLEFVVTDAAPGVLRVTTPPHRLDIQEGPADLIEELARTHGYDRLPATLLSETLPDQAGNRALEREERLRDLLVNLGLQEVITYSLTTPEREAPLGADQGDYVRLDNPISSERVVLRHSLLASVLEVTATNLKHSDDVRLFEQGYVYLPKEKQHLPDEKLRLAVVLAGWREQEFWGEGGKKTKTPLDFFDLKGVIESLAAGLHLTGVEYRRAGVPYLHPGRSAELFVGGAGVGVLGQLHPRVTQTLAKMFDSPGLAGRELLVADIDLDTLLSSAAGRHVSRPVSQFPPALRDVAVIVDESVTAEQVTKEIVAAGGDLLGETRLFDVYRGESIAPGKKSLAYALAYQAFDRTLTDKEVDKAHKKITDRLTHVLKASIRGQADDKVTR
jgi:phenylalanyl-tRNA synthetase beta chain